MDELKLSYRSLVTICICVFMCVFITNVSSCTKYDAEKQCENKIEADKNDHK